jgi:hypothetical protein
MQAHKPIPRTLAIPTLLLVGGGCAAEPRMVHVVVPAAHQAAVEAFVRFTPGPIELRPEGSKEELPGDSILVTLTDDQPCPEVGQADCFRLDGVRDQYEVHADGGLGLQYGLAEILERLGWRFHHPHDPILPDELGLLSDESDFGEVHAPEQSRRGIHLHTLHPIESLDSFWLRDSAHTERAERVIDWVVKNRGNYLQWVALDDITYDLGRMADWRATTATINRAAAIRGVETGLGIQLFGSSNLQNAFDLVDGSPGDPELQREAIDERLQIVTGLGFTEYNLSFGEFTGEDPEDFIGAVDQVSAVLLEREPEARLSAVVHVGDSPDQRVEYRGEDQIYYFLVRYADSRIIPYIHTVMFYNLFEDAGGAYHHEDFSEHLDYLAERLAGREPVVYFPESAYWIAFDSSVPQYLPLYLRSRWLDMSRIEERATTANYPGLDQHVQFSSGWEWGYWMGDVVSLRMGYTRDPEEGVEGWNTYLRQAFLPFGEEGTRAANLLIRLANLQADALITGRLAPYLAGRDAIMEVGFAAGVVAAPDRVEPDALLAMNPTDRATFRSQVHEPLQTYATSLRDLADEFAAGPPPGWSPWIWEIRDGLEISQHRANFVVALQAATLAAAEGADPEPDLAAALRAHRAAETVIARRFPLLHDQGGLTSWTSATWANPTIYQFGHLHHAHTLCYWGREFAKVELTLGRTADTPDACAL